MFSHCQRSGSALLKTVSPSSRLLHFFRETEKYYGISIQYATFSAAGGAGSANSLKHIPSQIFPPLSALSGIKNTHHRQVQTAAAYAFTERMKSGDWGTSNLPTALYFLTGSAIAIGTTTVVKAEAETLPPEEKNRTRTAKQGDKSTADVSSPAADSQTSDTQADEAMSSTVKPRLLLLGCGWSGMSFLKTIDTSAYDVTLVSQTNYFLFTPLLPGVTTGSIEARSVTEPVRKIIKNHKKTATFLESECIKIDPLKQTVRFRHISPLLSGREGGKGVEEFDLPYDYLVIGVGAEANTFNTPGVKEHAYFLKEVRDAERIRERIVDCMETASVPSLPEEEKRRLLHFVIVGGGPTGVEFSAELYDLIHDDLSKIYPKEIIDCSKITLIEAGDHILNMFDQRISDFAEKKFFRQGVDVQFGKMVVSMSDKEIVMKQNPFSFHAQEATKRQGEGGESGSPPELERLDHGLVVWSTGIGPRRVIRDLMEGVGQFGRRRALATDEWLRVKGCSNTWAMGDCASIESRRMRDDIQRLFRLADVDNSGTLSASEFLSVLKRVEERYPQMAIFLRHTTLKNFVQECYFDENGGKAKEIELKEFEDILAKIDAKLKSYPATAQVAAQQGAYLASCFNRMADPNFSFAEGPPRINAEGRHSFKPFRYRHLGQFAPLGSGQTGAELPGDWINVGRSSQWLWYSVYASKQISWRTRASVVFDWSRKAIFGRDSSRM